MTTREQALQLIEDYGYNAMLKCEALLTKYKDNQGKTRTETRFYWQGVKEELEVYETV